MNRVRSCILQLGLLLLFLLSFLVIYPEGISAIASTYIGEGDTTLYVWLTKQNVANILNHKTLSFNLPFFYPLTNTATFSDNYFLPSVISAAIYYLSDNWFLSFNLPLIFAFVLNGYLTFKLAFYLSNARVEAVFAALLFQLTPFLLSEWGHPQLIYAFFFPGTLLCCLRFFEEKSLLAGFLIGLQVLAAFLCSVYYSLFLIVLVVIALSSLLLVSSTKSKFADCLKLVVVNIPCLIALFFIAHSYSIAAFELGARRLRDVPIDPWLKQMDFFGFEQTALVYLVSAFYWLCLFYFSYRFFQAAKRRSDKKILYAFLLSILGVVFLFLAWGRIAKVASSYIHPTLFVALFKFMPGFNAIRAPDRFMIVVFLVAPLLIHLALTALKLKNRKILVSATSCCFVLLAMKSYELPTINYSQTNTDSVYQALKEEKDKQALIILPYPKYDYNEVEYAALSTTYMHRAIESEALLVNGYSGKQPDFHKQLHYKLKNFPDAESIKTLQNIAGLNHVVVVSHFIKNFKRDDFLAKIAKYNSDLELIAETNGEFLFHLKRDLLLPTVELIVPSFDNKMLCLAFRRETEMKASPILSLVELSPGKRQIYKSTFFRWSKTTEQCFDLPQSKDTLLPRRYQLEQFGRNEPIYLTAAYLKDGASYKPANLSSKLYKKR